MRFKFILSHLAVVLLVVSCFLPWISFAKRGIAFRGIDEMNLVLDSLSKTEINWGKPGYFNLLWAFVFMGFLFIRKAWAKWVLLVATALNMAWSFRNFLLLPACGGGADCPVRRIGLYLLLIGAILMFVSLLVPEKTGDNVPAPGKAD